MKNFLIKDWRLSKDSGILVIRMVFAFLLIYGHGWGKLSTIFGGDPIEFLDPIGLGANLSFYLAAFAEGICALLLIFGLFTRYAAIILTINFLVICYFHGVIHDGGFNIMESRLLYLFGFISLIFSGPGKHSLDNILFAKKDK